MAGCITIYTQVAHKNKLTTLYYTQGAPIYMGYTQFYTMKEWVSRPNSKNGILTHPIR